MWPAMLTANFLAQVLNLGVRSICVFMISCLSTTRVPVKFHRSLSRAVFLRVFVPAGCPQRGGGLLVVLRVCAVDFIHLCVSDKCHHSG